MLTNKTLMLLLLAGALLVEVALGQRDSNTDDDFDDAGFDDSGYNQPQNHDSDSSNQNPSNYSPVSEDDLDDDDDVDETHVSPQVLADGAPARADLYPNVAPARFYSSPNSLVLADFQPEQVHRQRRLRRSAEQSIEESPPAGSLTRRKRHSKYIGPVYTYVKTDKHAHYKWGVKHKVGKHYG